MHGAPRIKHEVLRDNLDQSVQRLSNIESNNFPDIVNINLQPPLHLKIDNDP